MIDILHSFFAGITFAVGVTVGALLCRIATKEGRKELTDDVKASHARIEERLLGSLLCHERIATSLELLTKRESDGENAYSPLFWVNIAWNPDENYTPEWETMTKERYQEEWSADDEAWGEMVTAGAACLKLNEKPPQTEKGPATHQGGKIPWDVLPLLRYIANRKKYLEEMGYEDDECDMDWARSRANFMLTEHAKFHGENV